MGMPDLSAKALATRERIAHLYATRNQWFPLTFFIAGFIFDALTLDRVDSLLASVRQLVYLAICAGLLGFEVGVHLGRVVPRGRWMETAWKYQQEIIHFFLGSLLSEYMLLYFKSSSLVVSFVFIVILAAVLVVNEFRQVQGTSGVPIRATYFSLCLISYFIVQVPVVLGFVGWIPFLLALGLASALAYGFSRLLTRRLSSPHADEQEAIETTIRKQITLPYAAVAGLILALYVTQLIPPVPLSLNEIGIYHEIEKKDGQYRLGYTRPSWRFWESGDQTFISRPGDRIFCFINVFSPSRFSDSVRVRWLFDDPKQGWIASDAIPVQISGGRDQGYRGFTYKANFQPGQWQVRVETNDGRELGRIKLRVILEETAEKAPNEAATPREMRYDEG
jgi:hypothetical protein